VDSGLTLVWPARSWRVFVLAWLIVVLAAPTPVVQSAGLGCAAESGGEDPAPEDASPAENETPQDENLLSQSAPRRNRVLDGLEQCSYLVPTPDPGQPSAPMRSGRPGSVHLLSVGRSLRLWLGSLTC
jgi:hypothetical protein